VDLKFLPEDDQVLRAIPELKNRLRVNCELASPAEFIPVDPGGKSAGSFIVQLRRLSFYHFDLYAQALAKVNAGMPRTWPMSKPWCTENSSSRLAAREYFTRIEPALYRFPAI